MENLVTSNGKKVYCIDSEKAYRGATAKQVNYLLHFKNVMFLDNKVVSISQMTKRIEQEDMSELIDLAKSGEEIYLEG